MEQMSAGWEDPSQTDWGNEKAESVEPVASSSASASATQTFKCTALYSYTVIINCLKLNAEIDKMKLFKFQAQNPDELSIVESEQLEVVGEGDGDGWLRARNYRGEEGFVPHNYLDVERDVPNEPTSNQLTSQISFSSVDYTVDNEDQDVLPDSVQSPDQVSVISAPVQKKSHQMFCIALYDYDATAEDELTFEEGQVRIYKLLNYQM